MLRQAGVDVHEGRVDLAAEQVGHRRRAALVGNVQAGGAGLLPEQLGGEVVAGAVAGGGEAHLAGVGLVEREHVGERLVRRVRRHRQDVGRLDRDRQVVEVLQRVVGDVLDQVRPDHERPERRDEDRVAVGRGALGRAGADRAAGAGLVVDDEGAAELFLQLRRRACARSCRSSRPAGTAPAGSRAWPATPGRERRRRRPGPGSGRPGSSAMSSWMSPGGSDLFVERIMTRNGLRRRRRIRRARASRRAPARSGSRRGRVGSAPASGRP